MTGQTFTADDMRTAVELAYWSGRTALEDDLDEIRHGFVVRPMARATYEMRVQQRLAEMAWCAERLAAAMGRPGYVYPGGPVDWDTGQPVRHLVAAA